MDVQYCWDSHWVSALAGIASPRLTWYGEQRIELSGQVVSNWVIKTQNLLAGDLAAEPGGVLALGLGLSWRDLLWRIAGWGLGLTVKNLTDAEAGNQEISTDPDLVACAVTDPESGVCFLKSGIETFLVSPSPLAWRYPSALPEGFLDGNREVLSQADQLLFPLPDQASLIGDTSFEVCEDGQLISDFSRWCEQNCPGNRILIKLTTDSNPQSLALVVGQIWSYQGAAVVLEANCGEIEKISSLEHISEIVELNCR
ncbi:TIGR03089 family protein [Varibaculum vaginae]|uniref:TIGR03089 family protein n=1 Tax=Varibaculum vaginae TaxID=2364797 RepID=UPI000F08C576|nr:TIGR03089 family protein [Varibaculum vaginae]